jgi:hypothetical protein
MKNNRKSIYLILLCAILISALFTTSPARAQAPPQAFNLVEHVSNQVGAQLGAALQNTGITAAANAAVTVVGQVVNGQVPVISDLQDPFKGNIQQTVNGALLQAKAVTDVLGQLATPQAQVEI